MALTQRFDRDAFHSLPTPKAAEATIEVLSTLQHRPPEEQVAALAACFLLITERYRIPAQDAFSATSRMMNHVDNKGSRVFDAARYYLDEDVFVSRDPLAI